MIETDSALDGAAAPIVTSAMIEAGLEVLFGYYPETIGGDAEDREMVAEMFRVMRAEQA